MCRLIDKLINQIKIYKVANLKIKYLIVITFVLIYYI